MLFSRSPFIALAVSAMIGSCSNSRHLADRPRRLVAVHLRHHDVHQHEVDVGVLLAAASRPSRPFSAKTTSIPWARARSSARTCCARRRRRSAPSCRRTPRRRCAAARASSASRPGSLASTRCRNSAVSSSSRSGERTSLTMIVSAKLLEPRLLAAGQLLAGVDDDRQVAEALRRLDLLEQLEAAAVREASGRAPCSRSAAPRAPRAPPRREPTADRVDVVAADQLDDRVALDVVVLDDEQPLHGVARGSSQSASKAPPSASRETGFAR